MALRSVPDHPKFSQFKSMIRQPKGPAIGWLEMIWHFCGKFTPQGNIGKYSDEAIESWVEWDGEPGALIDALVKSKWVDKSDDHRLVVHDWHNHADSTTRKQLGRMKLNFVSDMSSTKYGHVSDMSGTCLAETGKETDMSGHITETAGHAVDLQVQGQVQGQGQPLVQLEQPVGFTADMIAREVMKQAGMSSDKVYFAVRDQIKLEMGHAVGIGLDENLSNVLRNRMANVWLKFQRSTPRLDYKWGADKFFGEGYWRDESTWPWKDGEQPVTKAQSSSINNGIIPSESIDPREFFKREMAK